MTYQNGHPKCRSEPRADWDAIDITVWTIKANRASENLQYSSSISDFVFQLTLVCTRKHMSVSACELCGWRVWRWVVIFSGRRTAGKKTVVQVPVRCVF